MSCYLRNSSNWLYPYPPIKFKLTIMPMVVKYAISAYFTGFKWTETSIYLQIKIIYLKSLKFLKIHIKENQEENMSSVKRSIMAIVIVMTVFALLAISGCKSSAENIIEPEASTEPVSDNSQAVQEKEETAVTAGETVSTETVTEETEQVEDAKSEGLKDEISLPDGWVLTDAISAEEVGEITGEAMTYFPEASSAAQDGKPAGSYLISGKDGSKIGFYVFVNGGEEEFNNPRNFMIEGSDIMLEGIGDLAYLCDFENGSTDIVIIKGKKVIRVRWNPAIYNSFEKEDFGRALAGKLLSNMYK